MPFFMIGSGHWEGAWTDQRKINTHGSTSWEWLHWRCKVWPFLPCSRVCFWL